MSSYLPLPAGHFLDIRVRDTVPLLLLFPGFALGRGVC